MSNLPPSENDAVDATKVYQQMENFKTMTADQEYKRIKRAISSGNMYNPLKIAGVTLQFTLNVIFGAVFDIIGGFLGVLALPFGKWKWAAAKNRFKSVHNIFDTVGRVLQGLIMVIINAVVRCLLSPDWWITVAKVAKKHSKQHSISYKQSTSLCVAQSFVTMVEE